MSIAVILFGIYHGSRNRNYEIIINVIKENLKNIQNFAGDKQIDLFLSTNHVNDSQDKYFSDVFKFKSEYFDKEDLCGDLSKYDNMLVDNKCLMGTAYKSRCKKEINAIELCMNYAKTNNISYEYYIVTRVDLLILKNLRESNIKLNCLNIVSECEVQPLICDNFYLFPSIYLNKFYEIIKTADEVHHYIKYIFEKHFEINYILNEKRLINDLSFYKLIRG